ncbi:alpha/beta hydrolase [Ktedonospora formicarum]|uniref:Esterase n=1 Tax=Ktedonospora formicarum TaxID=2778364 RepID=A0A8J3MQN3_9CHLR|nr:alpha/beta hydrolase-fold protein [Ktedonospora formicarum]GHO45087.1 hypothetical protein KSX_32500 [Ktedonospora formicarum]
MNTWQLRLQKLIKRVDSFSLLLHATSLLAALLSGLYLFNNTNLGGLTSSIVDMGLDPLRAQLIAALVLVAAAALIGALLGRRKVSAIVGGAIVFGLGYLKGFIKLELQPVYDPGGHLEPLQQGALLSTLLIMIALALVSAFVGAAVGRASGEVILDPPLQILQRLVTRLWLYWRVQRYQGSFNLEETPTSPQLLIPSPPIRIITSWAGALVLLALLLLVLRSGDLFIFSPDIGLHAAPNVQGSGVSTIKQDYVKSKALGLVRPFEIYLPPSYNTPAGKERHYPVLYLLHGSPGKDVDWLVGGKAGQSADTLIKSGQVPELIMIMPDGHGRSQGASEWGNSYNQKQRVEDYLATDLVNYVDQHYRTIPDASHRAIGGNSMGGFGAANIAIHHPTIFGAFISLGGYYYAEGSIWGTNSMYKLQNSPAYTIEHTPLAHKLRIYLGSATKDQPYYHDTQDFMKELTKLKIPYHFDLQKGYHAWGIWATQMYNALIWLKWSDTTKKSETNEAMLMHGFIGALHISIEGA